MRSPQITKSSVSREELVSRCHRPSLLGHVACPLGVKMKRRRENRHTTQSGTDGCISKSDRTGRRKEKKKKIIQRRKKKKKGSRARGVMKQHSPEGKEMEGSWCVEVFGS